MVAAAQAVSMEVDGNNFGIIYGNYYNTLAANKFCGLNRLLTAFSGTCLKVTPFFEGSSRGVAVRDSGTKEDRRCRRYV